MNSDSDQQEAETSDPSSYPNAVIVILAAGCSSRMGQSKQLLDIGGETLLSHAARLALAARPLKVIIVLGSNEPSHRGALAGLAVEIVVNHYWKVGMGSSIKTGLHYVIQEHGDAAAVLFMVCDQPTLTSSHLDTLLQAFLHSDRKIAASSYDNTLGVPVVFGRSFFSNILMLGDDQGAKKIIDQFSEQVIAVPFVGGAIDLDTVEDYTQYLKTLGKASDEDHLHH